MQTIVSNPWFIFIVAIIGVIGAFASIRALRKKKPTQKISVGGAAKGTISQLSNVRQHSVQEVEVQGGVNGVIGQRQD